MGGRGEVLWAPAIDEKNREDLLKIRKTSFSLGFNTQNWLLPVTSGFFKQKTAYGISTRDWSSDVCSSDLRLPPRPSSDAQPPARSRMSTDSAARLEPPEHSASGCVWENADSGPRPVRGTLRNRGCGGAWILRRIRTFAAARRSGIRRAGVRRRSRYPRRIRLVCEGHGARPGPSRALIARDRRPRPPPGE